MAYPKAYSPEYGYKYQILSKYLSNPYEHCDYAKDRKEMKYLLNEYKMAYGYNFTFKVILLPKKYWKEICTQN